MQVEWINFRRGSEWIVRYVLAVELINSILSTPQINVKEMDFNLCAENVAIETRKITIKRTRQRKRRSVPGTTKRIKGD